MPITRLAACLAVRLAAAPALAHPGGPGTGLAQGFVHPFGGLDHLLAMVAVGAWAAQLGGRARWQVPAGFVLAMLLGAAGAVAGLALPLAEAGIAASVLALGLLVALAVRLPVALGATLVAVFAVFHGHAHGSELPVGESALGYALGFAAATTALHGAGLIAGTRLPGGLGAGLVRAGGAGAAAAGLAMMLG
jgi:urease accessory protein